MTEPYDVMRMALISSRQRFQNMMRAGVPGADLLDQARQGFNETDAALENPAGFNKTSGMPVSASVNEPLPME